MNSTQTQTISFDSGKICPDASRRVAALNYIETPQTRKTTTVSAFTYHWILHRQLPNAARSSSDRVFTSEISRMEGKMSAEPQRIIMSLEMVNAIGQKHAATIRSLLALVGPDDFNKYDDYTLLCFEAQGLEWQVVQTRNRRLALLVRCETAIAYASDVQESIPVDIVQQVHDGMTVFTSLLFKKFPVLRDRCRPLVNLAYRLRDEGGPSRNG